MRVLYPVGLWVSPRQTPRCQCAGAIPAALSLTLTSPVGVPMVELTVKVTENAVFTLDGSGVWPVMVVVEFALFTDVGRSQRCWG